MIKNGQQPLWVRKIIGSDGGGYDSFHIENCFGLFY